MAKRRRRVKRRRVVRRRKRNPLSRKRSAKQAWRRRRARRKGSAAPWAPFPRKRNNNKEWITGIAIGGATLLGAKLLSGVVDSQLSKSGKNPLSIAAGNLTPVVVPLAGSFLMLKYGNKLIKKDSTRNIIVSAMGMAGVVMALRMFITKSLPPGGQDVAVNGEANQNGDANGGAAKNKSGYVLGMRGYQSTPMLESYHGSKGLGAMKRSIPYGTGLPIQERTYNNFKWQGTLAKSIFED